MLPLRELPDELQALCTHHLDRPSAGRFAAANRACWRVVRERLEKLRLEYTAAQAAAAAAQAALAPPPRRITFTTAGKAFIDSYLDMFINASPSARKVLVEHVLQAAAGHDELGSANWNAQSVVSRLKNARSARNAVA
jgi:hypothetical protein